MEKYSGFKGHRERVKEKIRKIGISGMADYEVLEILLFMVIPRRDTKELAKELLKEFKTIENILNRSQEELIKHRGITENNYPYLKYIKELIKYIHYEQMEDNKVLNSVERTYSYLKATMGLAEKEIFKLIYLNSRNEVLGVEDLFIGTIDRSAIYPREVVKEVLRYNARSVIFAHNHPSGSLKPSTSDREITKKLKNILEPLDIRVLDHIIISKKGYYSFLEEGIL